MERFIGSVREALNDKNWYGALTTSLTMPDICGRLESPQVGSRRRYVNWFDHYLIDRYTRLSGGNAHVFLCGDDCYALRCSYLHEGGNSIEEQRARKALRNFHFVAPRRNWTVHLNQANETLQLQVDIFCEDICEATERWNREVLQRDAAVQERAKGLLTVHSMEGGFVL